MTDNKTNLEKVSDDRKTGRPGERNAVRGTTEQTVYEP